jgi:hypothetical protein
LYFLIQKSKETLSNISKTDLKVQINDAYNKYIFGAKDFENEDVDIYKSAIYPQCENMTYKTYLRIFNNDIVSLAKILDDNKIPIDLIEDYTKCGQIVSYLIRKGKLDPNVCNL